MEINSPSKTVGQPPLLTMTGRRNSGGRDLRSKRSRNDSELTAREARLRARLTKAEQASSGPPPNESEQIAAPHDGLMRAYCKEAIANTDDYVIITPCEHQLCTLCTLRSHTSRGRKGKEHCHCCPGKHLRAKSMIKNLV